MICSIDPSAGAASFWTIDREEMARRLYLDEGLTASEVALALGGGVSRSAVIAKMIRMGCAKRAAAADDRAPRKGASRVVRPQATGWTPRREPSWPPQPLPPLREAPLQGPPARLAELDDDACRWPIDDPGCGRMDRALFCAAPAGPGSIYCAAHAGLAAAPRKGRP